MTGDMAAIESDAIELTRSRHSISTKPSSLLEDENYEPSDELSSRYRTELREDLKERHVSMITFAACIGVGVFLQSGQIIYLAGPGLAVIAYLLIGSIIWSVMGSLGEMSALFPMTGGIFVYPARFLDQGIGYAAGWLTWFSWAVIIASEVLAVSQLFNFRFETTYLKNAEYPQSKLQWSFGQDTSPLVWVGICLILIFIPNCLPVRWYGRIEYFFGCIKLIFLVGLAIFNVTLNALDRVHHVYGNFWTYNEPYSFAAHNVTLRTPYNSITQILAGESAGVSAGIKPDVLTGSSGVFLAMWSAMTTVVYSMIGFETISVTAGENKDLRTAETIKIATRKISLRIIVLYALLCFCGGLNVPYTDPYLQDLTANAVRSGTNSVFMLALVHNRVTGWPHFFNAFFIFSALTSGMNALYLSSRILHALACVDDVWPPREQQWYYLVTEFRKNLARTIGGVPLCAVFVSWLFGFLSFLAVLPNTSIDLGRLATNSIVSMLLVYTTICASFINFHKAIGRAKGDALKDNLDPGINLSAYDRLHARYPYKSHGQRGRALYGFIGCVMLIFVNGWRSFVSPFSIRDFMASYISILTFLLLVVFYHIKLEGYNPMVWTMRASWELQDPRPLVVANEERRGILKLPENGLTKKNLLKFVQWVWVWLK